ncbi:MAG: hypothetical protein IJ026_06780 [Candidatus Methanomethylophilaceae archaeon]|nr:hypothetical protein [Candidatus Methanomethylophilaceae archaeon]
MEKRPLVTTMVVFAALLMVMSFAIVAFPQHIEILAVVSAVVAVAAIAVLVVMFIRLRRSV